MHAKRILFLILLLAFGLRVTAAVLVDRYVAAQGRTFLIEGDANGYWQLAQKIVAGQDYAIHHPPRYVLRTPGFPLFLAASIHLFGDSVLAASLLLAGVGTGCCWLTYCLGKRLIDEQTALMAAAFMSVSPLQVGNSVLILSETLFAFWVLLSLLALARVPATWWPRPFEKRPSPRSLFEAAIAGAAAGLTTLVRPGWILWAGLGASLLAVFGTDRVRLRLIAIAAFGLCCFAVLLPWAYRNSQATGHWVFTSLWSGPSLYDGLHPDADGSSDMSFVDNETVFATKSEFEANAEYKRRAWEFVANNPRRTLELALIKAQRYLSLTPNASGFSGGPLSLICLLFYLLFYGMVLTGVWLLRDRPAVVALLTAPFLQFLLVHMVFIGSVRYRLPVEFPLAVLAAVGVMGLLRKWDFRQQTRVPRQTL